MNNTTTECVDLLRANLNLILTGAPGTGKTYLSKQIAAQIIAGCDWEHLPQATKDAQVKIVQFHPSYDYTDFVEGLRPEKPAPGSTNILFRRQDGVFKAFCAEAIRNNATTTPSTPSISLSFQSLLAQIIKDIETKILAGTTPTYTKTGTLKIDKNRITYIRNNGDTKKTREDYLEVLFNHYISSPNLDIKKITGNELENIISGHTKGTVTKLDTTEYLWTIKKLLDFYQAEKAKAGQPLSEAKRKPYVFIIDEINRGELSKIFGELFSVIEADYRNEYNRINTQYQNLIDSGDVFEKGFYIPDYVYIIGTMNDVDRGVESIDFAIRRRFAWKEVTAEESATNMGITGLALKKMEAINDALLAENLTNAYKIGGAFFRKFNNNSADFGKLWKNHLHGIIYEYFRGEPEVEDIIKRIYGKYDKAIISAPTPASATAPIPDPTLVPDPISASDPVPAPANEDGDSIPEPPSGEEPKANAE